MMTNNVMKLIFLLSSLLPISVFAFLDLSMAFLGISGSYERVYIRRHGVRCLFIPPQMKLQREYL